ncbi:MAG: DUF1501 domain-containing protein [Planctomycetota bacterium]|nr:DUF1501 domain-containing protein [Planctomycetota bacterium]
MIDLPGILATNFHRRRLLQVGAYGAFASALNQSRWLRGATDGATSPIRSCIFLMHYGGPSHLDTWDMKVDAPAEIRGEYQPIATNVPGCVVCEHLPMMSRLVDKVAVIRSMHHTMNNHNSAMYEALIGRLPSGGDKELLGVDRANDFPSIGSTMTYLAAEGKLRAEPMPLTNVALPYVMRNVIDLAGQNAGFLGGRYDPLQITTDPNQPDFSVRELTLPGDVTARRLSARRDLLETFNVASERHDSSLESYRQRAFDLLQNANFKRAFQMASEPAEVRQRYGRHTLGQSLLLARRLVEAGVRFVNVNDRSANSQNTNWDSHETIFPRHKELLAPADQGFSALVEDLDQRGLLNSTLVVAMGEFGRTPKINGNAGRDHWPQCYHVLMAGGGVNGGTAFGSSDSIGAYPDTDPVTPGDLAATIFWRFGVDHSQEIHDGFGRPFRLADGQPIREMFS